MMLTGAGNLSLSLRVRVCVCGVGGSQARKLVVARKEQQSTGRQLELFRQTVSQHGIDNLDYNEVQELLSQVWGGA